MTDAVFFPEWSEEDKALLLRHESERPANKTRTAMAKELAPQLGRTYNAIKHKLFKLAMTPEQKARWRLTENKRYRDRVPAYRNRSELEMLSSRPTPKELQNHDARCKAPVRDLTAALCGDPPVGYSALERRA